MQRLTLIKIKNTRKTLQFSQADMAKKLNISQMAYSKIERGVTQLNLDKINKIAKILSINLWDLIDDKISLDKVEKSTNPNKIIELLDNYFQKQENTLKQLKKENQQLKAELKQRKT